MRSIVILGLGLIGGSAGMALRRRGWRVAFVDPHVSVDQARAAGAADEEGGDGDVILLATPVEAALAILPTLAARGVVTSACSVMAPLRRLATSSFVAGHPLAGSHERGLAAARADLFEGKRWFVDGEDERVDAVIRDCGAQRELVDAADHDAAVAVTSHLPQVLSTALAAYVDERPELARYAGSGLSTFLRLAGSDATVWRGVLDANRDNILPHLEAVTRVAREMLEGESDETFARAQRLWRNL